MRGRGLLLLSALSAVLTLSPAAEAQFSPQGVIGAVTAPLRQMLGRFGHFPYGRRHGAPEGSVTATAPGATENTRLARLGPPAWPSVYADMLGFVFWPTDYGEVKERGFEVIAETIVGLTGTEATTGTAPGETADCNSGAINDWPGAQVEKTAQLAGTQQQALQKIQAAVEQSTKAVTIDCRNPNEVAAPARLGGLIQALWTARDSALLVRQPLIDFDNSLSEAQKTAFAPPVQATPQPAASNAPSKEMQACAAQNIGEAERMMKTIGGRVRPNRDQAGSLENLHKVSVDMAKLLATTCAQPVSPDLSARLDAVADQLTTMNYAATTVQIAFADFYGKLDEQQKARLGANAR